MSSKPQWKIFLDLQCPYSCKFYLTHYDSMVATFGDQYDFSIHLTVILFHFSAYRAACATKVIEKAKGQDGRDKFIRACFEKQDKFLNAAVGDMRPSEVNMIFAGIAKDAGLLDGSADTVKDEAAFAAAVNDIDNAAVPAWTEFKHALSYGAIGAPKHVINDKLVADTESSWGPTEWAEKLKTLA